MTEVWLLVEWVDERSTDIFPKYGIVYVGPLTGEYRLYVGKTVYVRDKRGSNPRQAKILRMSNNKHHLKEDQKLMESQDRQVNNMFALWMRTMRDMKTGPLNSGLINFDQLSKAGPSGPNGLPQVVADTDSPDTDSDGEIRASFHQSRRARKLDNLQNGHYKRGESRSGRHSLPSRHFAQQSHRMVCSTPLPVSNAPLLTFDQATQTDPDPISILEREKQKIKELEDRIKELHESFLLLSADVENEVSADVYDMSESNEHNNTDGSESERNEMRSSPEQVGESGIADHSNVNGQPEPQNMNARMLQVRRVSAHTTNTNEPSYSNDNDMVPLGVGRTAVPRRLLNEIDWTSYSTATRQLLQAVFPRRVLATHSLTGKRSPAFLNKPPKKRLDPKIVNDIVDTVSERCGVSKRQVRNSITIKCTDESKLYRNRQQYQNARLDNHSNHENVPPLHSSDESSTVTE